MVEAPPPSEPRTLPRWLPQTLTGWIGLAVVVGLPLGLWAHSDPEIRSLVSPLEGAGALFIRGLKLLVIPVIVTSLVVGVTSMGDLTKVSQLGGRALAYYMATTALAAVVGLTVVNLIRPGIGTQLALGEVPDKALTGSGMGVGGMLKRVFGETLLDPIHSLARGDILTIIAACLLLGMILIAVGRVGGPVVSFFRVAERWVMRAVGLFMLVAPLGVLGLLVSSLSEGGLDALTAVGRYALCVVLALAIHGAVVLPSIVAVVGRRKPLEWLRGARPALLVAFSTSSSAATLPVTIETCEQELGVPKSVASFVLPLGATINMDGTALYEAIAALFVAQVVGIDLDAGQQIVVVITAMAASVGAAGIPSAGLVTMAMVFEAEGKIDRAREAAWRAAAISPDDVYLILQAVRLDSLASH